jgi:hypothetical protein
MHSDWFNGIEIIQGGWQYGERVGYCYPSGLEKTLCKWDIYVLLVTKGLIFQQNRLVTKLLRYIILNSLLYVLALIPEKYYVRISKESGGTPGLYRMFKCFKQKRISGKDIIRHT